MFQIPDNELNEKIRIEKQHLINGEPVTPGIVRPAILQCWKECLASGYNPDYSGEYFDMKFTDEEFHQILEDNKLLVDIALPFMSEIIDSIPGKTSCISLTDKNCNALIINTNDDEEYDNYHSATGILAGKRSQGNPLLPAFSEVYLCMKTGEPQYISGEENYLEISKDWTCIAAPIKDYKGELIGIIELSDTNDRYTHQNFGLVLSAARAIQNEYNLRVTNKYLVNSVEQLTALTESLDYGLILVDQGGYIDFANSYSKKILFIDKDTDLTGMKIGDILKDENSYFLSGKLGTMKEREMTINTPEGFKRYYISIKSRLPQLCTEYGNVHAITVKEYGYARDLANKVTAATAKFEISNIIGRSKKMTTATNLANIASKSTSNVLITGSSGTGKELFAHAIHSGSKRSDGPFISINCGALPANLVESELFGYEGGAFTGSKKNGQIGKFELANHGTLFLDEIGEMPLSVQASILRALDAKEITRIGGTHPIPIDVRIIAATNRNLFDEIKQKNFREDLYYRLNVLRIHVPPLRERKSDIRLLVNNFIEQYCEDLEKKNITFDDSAYCSLEEYDWPGNVRELENTVERIINVCDDDTVVDSDLISMFIYVDYPVDAPRQKPSSMPSAGQIKDVERDLIINTLKETNGSITESATAIGISRRTLYRKCEEYDIDYTQYRK